MRSAAFLLLALSLAPAPSWAAESRLQQQQVEARRDREALRERIAKLENQIQSSEASRQDVSRELKESETAISELDRRLEALDRQSSQAREAFQALQQAMKLQTQELGRRQQHLADQLRAQYASGLSPWAALLSGDDPQDIARELGYLEYVARAQAEALRAVRSALDELERLRAEARSREAELKTLAGETTQRREELQAKQAERLAVLERIGGELKKQRSEARNLAQTEAQLGKLVEQLGVAIEQEREAARKRAEEARRLAEERRLAEARRKAEEQRKEEERRKTEQRRQSEEQRKAEEARRAEASRRAEQERRAEQRQLQEMALPPELKGLPRPLPYPVRGEIQGRFGMARPDGGIWRGIVLRARQGTRVAAVAPGRVVYAGWLASFGNLMIIDHGEKFLSVYAYNQGLLKQVGDSVKAGESIATVGATGGQVEPGLYFEIRHDGKPVNPLLWLGGQ